MPLFRWVGGKRQILTALLERCPEDVKERRYFEPFFGAGSLFFALLPPVAYLGDANHHLMQAYEFIRDRPRNVAQRLSRLVRANSRENYYRVREQYNRGRPSAVQAARFIYLNRTSFNGVFRVNRAGRYNVPHGRIARPWFPSLGELLDASNALGSAELFAGNFEAALTRADRGDFVYLDPPYPPLNGTSYFSHYTKDRFGPEDQQRVAEVFRDLDSRGALVMLSNADTGGIRELYAGFNVRSLPVTRWVTSKQRKHKVRELIVTNY